MKRWFKDYEGIKKYSIHPTNEYEGRLQFNENLWGCSPKCLEVLKTISIKDIIYYDLEGEDYLVNKIASLLELPQDCFFVNSGSSEVIKCILLVILRKGDNVLVPNPGWGCYKGMIEAKLAHVIYYKIGQGESEYYHDIDDIQNKAKEYNPKMIIITSPQMPTGNIIHQNDLEYIISNNQDSIVLLDECYYGCTEEYLDIKYLVNKYDNFVVIRTLSKIYGLANLRVGYCIANPELINLFDYVTPLHKLPHVVRRVAVAAIDDVDYTKKNKQEIIEARNWLIGELNKRNGIKAYNSYSNFVYTSIEGHDAKKIYDFLESNKISTRLFDEEGETHMRITVAPIQILEKFIKLLDSALEKY